LRSSFFWQDLEGKIIVDELKQEVISTSSKAEPPQCTSLAWSADGQVKTTPLLPTPGGTRVLGTLLEQRDRGDPWAPPLEPSLPAGARASLGSSSTFGLFLISPTSGADRGPSLLRALPSEDTRPLTSHPEVPPWWPSDPSRDPAPVSLRRRFSPATQTTSSGCGKSPSEPDEDNVARNRKFCVEKEQKKLSIKEAFYRAGGHCWVIPQPGGSGRIWGWSFTRRRRRERQKPNVPERELSPRGVVPAPSGLGTAWWDGVWGDQQNLGDLRARSCPHVVGRGLG